MDISLETAKKPKLLKKYWYVLVIVLVMLAFFGFRSLFKGVSYVVDGDLLRVAKVVEGDFTVEVRSNGELAAKENQWISAEVAGNIEKIYVKVGDHVEEGDPLVQMRNKDLLTELEKLQWEYKQVSAEAYANTKNMESDLLQLESESLRAELAYKSNLLDQQAEEKLIKLGRRIISDIDHQRTIFSVQEQKQIWEFYQKRIRKMKESMEAQKRADDAQLEKLTNDLEKAQHGVDMLTIRSRSFGLVQEIDLDPGQKMDIGTTVARVADTSELIAELQVQELQVQNVELGQKVIIDTRKNRLNGKVIRVHPTVNNGTVQVDVEFVDKLSSEARVALSIEGSIIIHSLPKALYVQRPTYVQPNSTSGIYVFDASGNQAKRVAVQLGLSSVNHIQVLSGLQAGDQIIVSDTSAYAEHESILIN